MSFSPDGKYLATASRDRAVRLCTNENLDALLDRAGHWLQDYLVDRTIDARSI